MRLLLLLCALAITGCATQPAPEVTKLQHEVRNLKEEMTDMSKKLDKTNKTAKAASSKATAASTKAKAAIVEVKVVKETASKALDAASTPPEQAVPQRDAKIIKPREINHETSILP